MSKLYKPAIAETKRLLDSAQQELEIALEVFKDKLAERLYNDNTYFQYGAQYTADRRTVAKIEELVESIEELSNRLGEMK